MPKKVNGYLASDGQFFEREQEAAYHDAELALTKALEDRNFSLDWVAAIVDMANEIGAFLTTRKELAKEEVKK